MAGLETKIKHALAESRILMLGAQVVLGLQFAAVFQSRFDHLPDHSRMLDLAAMALLLITCALLMTPVFVHRLAEHGNDTRRFHGVVTRLLSCALGPFAIALGIDLGIAGEKIAGASAGWVLGLGAGGLALVLWIIGEELKAHHEPRYGDRMSDEQTSTPLTKRIEQVLAETRVLIPGAQALLGFQFTIILTDGFERLSPGVQRLHLASLGLMTLATILLMSPAAYHRIVERGEDTERFHRFAGGMLVTAAIPLALAIGLDVAVVIEKVLGDARLAAIAATLTVGLFYGLWFGYPFYSRGSAPGLSRLRRV